MMLRGAVGFTAIDVSLCGFVTPFGADASQSVFTFADVCVGVVQTAVPVLNADPLPKTPPVTGAAASRPLCECRKSIGCGSSPATATAAPTHSAATTETNSGAARSHPLRALTSSTRTPLPRIVAEHLVARLNPIITHRTLDQPEP